MVRVTCQWDGQCDYHIGPILFDFPRVKSRMNLGFCTCQLNTCNPQNGRRIWTGGRGRDPEESKARLDGLELAARVVMPAAPGAR